MIRTRLSPPNAILFVFDPSNRNVRVPEYVRGQLTAANATCVSVATQAPVDGETVVSLSEPEIHRHGLQKVFEGPVESPGRLIAVMTSEARRVLETSVSSPVTVVCVWVDDLLNPARLAIEVC